jgi:hypothetical protein
LRIKAAKLSIPMIAALAVGAVLIAAAADFPPELQLASIWMSFVGGCILACVLTKRLADRGWVRSNPGRLVLWGLCCLGCAAALVYAFRKHQLIRNPDTWLKMRVEAQDIPLEVFPGEVYQAVEMTPGFERGAEKVDNKTNTVLHWPPSESLSTVEANSPASFNSLGYLCEISNSGTKPLSAIELLFAVDYSHVRESDSRPLPSTKEVRVVIDSLSPGEVFSLIVYSKTSDLLSGIKLPKTVRVRLSNEHASRSLRVNRIIEKGDYPFAAITAGGPELLKEEKQKR